MHTQPRLSLTGVLMALLALAPCAAGQTFETLYSFNGPPIENGPQSLLVGGGGALYGTTYNGGAGNWGTVFSLTPPPAPGGAWTYTLLYSFTNGSDGACPVALVRGAKGVLYGLTSGCTISGYYPYTGMAFSLTPPSTPGGAWTQSTIFNFTSSSLNITQPASLALIGGVLYGTSLWGGTSTLCLGGCGLVFSLTPPVSASQTWTAKVLYSFPGPAPDQNPMELIAGPGRSFYGLAASCGVGAAACGEVFQLTPPSSPGGQLNETVLYGELAGWGGIALGSGGVIYGTTYGGGYRQRGTVFSLTPPASPGGVWTHSVLHHFGHGDDGIYPNPYLAIGEGGVLYGTTNGGGKGYGTVFAVFSPSSPGGAWTERVLHRFDYTTGGVPVVGVTIGREGVLYGTTTAYGLYGYGTVFALKP